MNFVSIGYSPFTDSLIIISVENNSTELFDYPGFVLINTDGDTVAKEVVNYFGIGSQSVHPLQVRAGVHHPLQNFEGTLQLYSGFYDQFECEWQLNESLCTENECDSIILAFENYGGALVLGDFHWSLLDSTEAVLDSGTFTMPPQEQHWEKRFCLPKGMYNYTLVALDEPSGGGPTMTVSTSPWYLAPTLQQYLDWFNNPANILEIPFYMHCLQEQSPNGTETIVEASELKVIRTGNQTILQHTDLMQSVDVYSIEGRLVAQFNPNRTQLALSAGLKSGLYIVSVQTDKGTQVVKVLLSF